MLQNLCKTLGFKKNMVYKIPPGGEVNHIQPVAYISDVVLIMLINVKMPTIVGILTFMSSINFVLS